MKGDDKKCFDAGCDGYLPKPIDAEELFRILARHLPWSAAENGDSKMKSEQTETRPNPIDSLRDQAAQMSQLCCDGTIPTLQSGEPSADCTADIPFDWAQMIGRIVDEDLVAEIVPVCITDNAERVKKLAEAVGKADSEAVKSFAHAIKGSSANMGAKRLSDVAYCLERMSSQGDLSEAAELLEKIRTEFEQLESFVSKPDWIETARSCSGNTV